MVIRTWVGAGISFCYRVHGLERAVKNISLKNIYSVGVIGQVVRTFEE